MDLVSALNLKVNLEELAELTKTLATKSLSEREEILKIADERLPKETMLKALHLLKDLYYHKEFCQQAGIDYSSISSENSRLIKTALSDYLMKKSNLYK